MSIGLVGAGCTSVNRQLNSDKVALENRKRNQTRAGAFLDAAPLKAEGDATSTLQAPEFGDMTITDNDGYFVGLAISGGGSRSANFGAACMFELQRIGILQHVDYISAVSGGSLPAACYCSWTDEQWNPEYVQKKLTHSFADELLWQTLLPWNVIGMMFTNLDRSDLLANSFRNNLFTRKGRELTFADLREDRPRLFINATDLQSGKPFHFSNESFDAINSDLSKYPLAYAVTGSSSVPVLLHQVTMRDFSTTFKQYVHVVDGGIVDNLGVQTLVNVFEVQSRTSAERHHQLYPKGAIFIVIDANTQFDAKLSGQGDIGLLESLRAGAGLSSTVLINRASGATLAELIVKYAREELTAKELRQQIEDLTKTGYLRMTDKRDRPVEVFHISLSQLGDLTDLPYQSFSTSVNNIATYFNIEPNEAFHLYQAANILVDRKFGQKLEAVATELASPTTTSAPTTTP